MAEFPLTRQQHQDLLAMMVQYGNFDRITARENFFEEAGYSFVPAIKSAIPLDGATRDFCITLVRILRLHGNLPDSNDHALYPLLLYLQEKVMGQAEERKKMDVLLALVAPTPQHEVVPQNPDDLFQSAMEFYRAEQWEQALAIFQNLKVQNYRFRSLDQLIQRATDGAKGATRRREMLADYKNVVALTHHSDDIPIAKEEWLAFLQEYREFTEQDDSQKLLQSFQAEFLVSKMWDTNRPLLERAQAGRDLAEVGAPRHGVGLDGDGIPDLAWCHVLDEGENPIGGDELAFQSLSARNVKIPAFWMAQFPITHLQFQAFVDAPDGYYHTDKRWWQGLAWNEPKHIEPRWTYDNHPRDTINWYECVAFCRWLTYRLKQIAPRRLAEPTLAPAYRLIWQGLVNGSVIVRLPTEQEWEKAARGKQGWKYGYQRNAPDPNRMNVRETGIGKTSAVGMFADSPSPYGVMDMSGNIWEWGRTMSNGKDNSIAGEAMRVLRGGSWSISASDKARAASSECDNPDARDVTLGGRAALAAPIK